jgi:hypothetical protein
MYIWYEWYLGFITTWIRIWLEIQYMVRVVNLSLEISILCKICLSFICKMWLTAICVKNESNSWQKPPELKNNPFCLQMSTIYLLDTVLGIEIRNLREMWILFPLPELQLGEYFQMHWELQTINLQYLFY